MDKFSINVFLLVIGAAMIMGQSCPGANTMWSSCSPACKDYCTKDPSEVCAMPCIPGCMCIPGHRYKGLDADYCVPEHECATCGLNEVYKVCGTACQDYCGKPPGTYCSDICIEGCFCKEGYVRQYNTTTALCIPKTSCP